MEDNRPGALDAFLANVTRNIRDTLRQDDKERVSIWSVTRPQAKIFFPVMIVLWAIALAYFAIDEGTTAVNAPLPDRVEKVMQRFGPMVIPLAAISMMIAVACTTGNYIFKTAIRRPIVKIADRIYRQFAPPVEKVGEARGEARGYALGKAEGFQHGVTQALEWARKKSDAEANGQPFDEPPPQTAAQQ